MQSEIKGIKNEMGGWDIKIRANAYSEVLKFYVIGFMKLIENIDDTEMKKQYIRIMNIKCDELKKELEQED